VTRSEWRLDLLKHGVINLNAARLPDGSWCVVLNAPGATGMAVDPDLLLAEEEALGDLRAHLAEQYLSATRGA
jgi:hypothetical protein